MTGPLIFDVGAVRNLPASPVNKALDFTGLIRGPGNCQQLLIVVLIVVLIVAHRCSSLLIVAHRCSLSSSLVEFRFAATARRTGIVIVIAEGAMPVNYRPPCVSVRARLVAASPDVN